MKQAALHPGKFLKWAYKITWAENAISKPAGGKHALKTKNKGKRKKGKIAIMYNG